MAAKRTCALAMLSASSLALAVGACEVGEAAEGAGGAGASGALLSGGSSGTASGSGGNAGAAGRGGVSAAGASGAGGRSGKGGAGAYATSGRGGSATSAGSGGRGAGGATGGKAGWGGFAGAANSGAAGVSGAGTLPESGCKAVSWPLEGVHTLTVGGVLREFKLAVPTDYDPSRAYPVIFSWHGLGGSMGSFYQLNSAARAGAAAIHLSPQGLDNAQADGAGWWNTDGQDLAFVDALIEWTEGSFCIDKERLFSVGFSFGGMFSHLLGCERGDVFRAIAPIAGSFYNYYGFGGAAACETPVPMLGIHGTADERVSVAEGEAARDVWVATNGCSGTTLPTEPAGCVLYQGCMSGYPVEWCTHDGTHMVPSFAADVIWQFFQGF